MCFGKSQELGGSQSRHFQHGKVANVILNDHFALMNVLPEPLGSGNMNSPVPGAPLNQDGDTKVPDDLFQDGFAGVYLGKHPLRCPRAKNGPAAIVNPERSREKGWLCKHGTEHPMFEITNGLHDQRIVLIGIDTCQQFSAHAVPDPKRRQQP